MRTGAAAAAAALAGVLGGCGSADEQVEARADDQLLQVDQALELSVEGVVSVEGSLSVRDGGEVRMCRSINMGGSAPECLDRYLVVEELDFDEVPRLSRSGDVRFAWPAIAVRGRVDQGVLTVTEILPVYRMSVNAPSDGSVALDRSGFFTEVQLSAGQELGLIGEWETLPELTVVAGEGTLRFTPPVCPADSECEWMRGYVVVDTRDMAPGLYSFEHEGTNVALSVALDPAPGDTTTDWSLPSTPA